MSTLGDGGGALLSPPLPLRLPRPRLPEQRLGGIGWLVLSGTAVTPDVGSLDDARCKGRGGVFFGSRWRIVRAGNRQAVDLLE